jgi:hypothetical protein
MGRACATIGRAMLCGCVAVALLVPAAARAGHYDLSSIDIVDEATTDLLAKQKVFTTLALWEATRTPAKVKALSRKVAVPAARLRELHDLCDLLWIDGIGPKVARVLTAGGIPDRKALGRQQAEPLADLIRDVNRKAQILGKLPDADTTRAWIEHARDVPRPGAPAH